MQQPQPQPQPEGEGNGERWWGFDGNYVLVGHSAGAALAMSVCSSLADGLLGAGPAVVLPRAVLGAAGIYDYAAMLEGKGEEFRQVMAEIYRSAFGTAEKGRLDGLSPAKIAIRGVKEVMLYWSRDDGLVGEEQVLAMEKCLKETEGVDLRVREVGGMSHEQMYECGWPLADAIESLMREL